MTMSLLRLRRCRPVVWTTLDSTLFVLFLVGACVLVITASVVWYPYWQTSDFYPGQCLVMNVTEVGPAQCRQVADRCLVGTHFPPTTSTSGPPDEDEDDFAMQPEVGRYDWLRKRPHRSTVTRRTTRLVTNLSTSKPTAASTSTTTTTTSSSSSSNSNMESTPTTVTVDAPSCSWFPCVQIIVLYYVKYDKAVYSGTGQLFADYTQLASYPRCSYSACDGESYVDNNKTISKVTETWRTRMNDKQKFDCFSKSNTVLAEVAYTFCDSFHSLFWPIMFCCACLLFLIVHVVWHNSLLRRKTLTTASRSESVNSGSSRLPSVHRRNVDASGATDIGNIYANPAFSTLPEGHADADHANSDDNGASCSWKNDFPPEYVHQPVDYTVVWTTSSVNHGCFDITRPPAYAPQYDNMEPCEPPLPPIDEDDPINDDESRPPPYLTVVSICSSVNVNQNFEDARASTTGADVLHRT